MTIKKFLFLLFVICGMAFSQDKPKIAVYVASGDLKDAEKKMLSTKILAPFVQSGQYRVIERSEAFLNNITRERQKQRDGSIDDSQISRIGKEAGAQFVCVADLVDAFGIYSVSARLINVESAEIVALGETEIKDLSEISNAANEIFRQISGGNSSGNSSGNNVAAKKPPEKRQTTKFEKLKQISEWREFQVDFSSKANFFNAARQGFMVYFKRYNPREFLRNDEQLVMTARYGKYDVMCTFFQDGDSRYIVALESEFQKGQAKWVNNVVKQVEKAERR